MCDFSLTLNHFQIFLEMRKLMSKIRTINASQAVIIKKVHGSI